MDCVLFSVDGAGMDSCCAMFYMSGYIWACNLQLMVVDELDFRILTSVLIL